MIEALARIRNDAVLSRLGKKPGPGRGLLQRAAERARSLPPRFYVGAVVSALLVGIGVNALILQRERHPAPLFASPPQKAAPPTPVAAPPAPVVAPAVAPPSPTPPAASAPREAPVPEPAARPAATGPGPARPADPIGDLLRAEPAADNSRLILAAQTALAKLGYPVKADGNQGASTDQALREFERDHGLPASAEITPRLVKQLNAAARSGQR
ncbi:MAG TPA: peptidoglycan-binding domain-containing protein [Roseiarcus sp.]|nr:peptidoglycan-binding domain-containing protein [Roseiarcus sp.]